MLKNVRLLVDSSRPVLHSLPALFRAVRRAAYAEFMEYYDDFCQKVDNNTLTWKEGLTVVLFGAALCGLWTMFCSWLNA